MASVAPPPIEPGDPRPGVTGRGCARSALIGCGAVALVIAVAMISFLIYIRRHPERMTDALMRQVESNFASDVTPQEKEDLRAAYSSYRETLVRGTASRQSLQDLRSVMMSGGFGRAVTRDQVRNMTEIFRTGARRDAPTGTSPMSRSPGAIPSPATTP
jgi:hypothetical protein